MTGSLQIKKGKYYAVLNFKDENGKRKQKWVPSKLEVKNNKKKAEKFLRDTISEYEKQEEAEKAKAIKRQSDDPKEQLFSEYIKIWLKSDQYTVDEITFQGYEITARTQVIPYFEEKEFRLCDINLDVLQQYMNDKLQNGRIDGKGGLSPKSLEHHKTVISLALNHALDRGLISENPCKKVKMPKKQKRAPNFFNSHEMNDFFAAIKNEELYPLLYFTVIFALRRSEVLGLCWDAIDWERKTIVIKRTIVRVSKTVQKETTKTESSMRSYPMTPEIEKILLQLREKEKLNRSLFKSQYNKNDYIFKWPDGHPYSPDYVSQKFPDLLKKYGFRHIRFHDLRHSCASVLLSMGFSLKDIQIWLGHSDIQVTADVYVHLDLERKQDIARTMANSFEYSEC